ncbi:forkhead box protein M1 isoform X2 [Rhinatrema bivittatum]|uniref:forkhead box protein M1 isoform X2 n=1 Tax=Rhinatrema bivittatum TaxID=194408 RepID=UPI0011292A8F|nr:forkhead box protein M1 isoform X2 [Rhinatrema bivittatum]
MRTSPRRPLILRRRKLPLPLRDAPATDQTTANNQPDKVQREGPSHEHIDERTDAGTQKFPAGIKIVNHPTMPNTQVVIIPKNADIQSIIEALTAKGKESGSSGPNKFILISCSGTPRSVYPSTSHHSSQTDHANPTEDNAKGVSCQGEKSAGQDFGDMKETGQWPSEAHFVPETIPGYKDQSNDEEVSNCALDDSLTNIQWLGRMSSDGLGSCSMKQELDDKENVSPEKEGARSEEDISATPCSSSTSWRESFAERPPYSYMAMIQFAINSTEGKRMTLKEIYTWIEDHFPYFKHVAKPGWKNSIRHNLSLHDMFVREIAANGKISFWTIHPDANRCLTLDQVFKPLDPGSPTSTQHCEPHQKRFVPELQKGIIGNSYVKASLGQSERKMKPLLPRISSYLVPIQFPLNPSLLLQPSTEMAQTPSQGPSFSNAELGKSSKRVRLAPKAPMTGEEPSPFQPVAFVRDEDPFISVKQEEDFTGMSEDDPFITVKHEEVFTAMKEENLFTSVKQEETFTTIEEENLFTTVVSPSRKFTNSVIEKHPSSSRRKQRLVLPCLEEPVLVFPECNDSDSGMASDFSFLQQSQPFESSALLCIQEEGGPFKTPIKEKFSKLLAASTPSKPINTASQVGGSELYRTGPPTREESLLDFSPVHVPQGSMLTPFKDNLGLLGFTGTPFKDTPLFDSPRDLLNTKSPEIISGPLTSSPTSIPHSTKRCSKELHVGSSGNRSVTEGLVLDTMNDSLSKILLDISFTGLEDDDDFGVDNVSWSQLIPELR